MFFLVVYRIKTHLTCIFSTTQYCIVFSLALTSEYFIILPLVYIFSSVALVICHLVLFPRYEVFLVILSLLLSNYTTLRSKNTVCILGNLLGLPSAFSLSVSFSFKSVSWRHTGPWCFLPHLVPQYLLWFKAWIQKSHSRGCEHAAPRMRASLHPGALSHPPFA